MVILLQEFGQYQKVSYRIHLEVTHNFKSKLKLIMYIIGLSTNWTHVYWAIEHAHSASEDIYKNKLMNKTPLQEYSIHFDFYADRHDTTLENHKKHQEMGIY